MAPLEVKKRTVECTRPSQEKGNQTSKVHNESLSTNIADIFRKEINMDKYHSTPSTEFAYRKAHN